jgi:hypothetical protein
MGVRWHRIGKPAIAVVVALALSGCAAASGPSTTQPVVTVGGQPFVPGNVMPALAAQYPIGKRVDVTARYLATKDVTRPGVLEQRGISFELSDGTSAYCFSGRGQIGSTEHWPENLGVRLIGTVSGHIVAIKMVELKDCTITPRVAS